MTGCCARQMRVGTSTKTFAESPAIAPYGRARTEKPRRSGALDLRISLSRILTRVLGRRLCVASARSRRCRTAALIVLSRLHVLVGARLIAALTDRGLI